MTEFSLIRLFHDLRRRRMIQVTLLYAAAAWGVIGACDLLLPQWVSDSDAAMRFVFVGAILLAPIALILGWLYNITGSGVSQHSARNSVCPRNAIPASLMMPLCSGAVTRPR